MVRFSEGKAHYQQKGYILAESCWQAALKLDPRGSGGGLGVA